MCSFSYGLLERSWLPTEQHMLYTSVIIATYPVRSISCVNAMHYFWENVLQIWFGFSIIIPFFFVVQYYSCISFGKHTANCISDCSDDQIRCEEVYHGCCHPLVYFPEKLKQFQFQLTYTPDPMNKLHFSMTTIFKAYWTLLFVPNAIVIVIGKWTGIASWRHYKNC